MNFLATSIASLIALSGASSTMLEAFTNKLLASSMSIIRFSGMVILYFSASASTPSILAIIVSATLKLIPTPADEVSSSSAFTGNALVVLRVMLLNTSDTRIKPLILLVGFHYPLHLQGFSRSFFR